FQLVGASRNVCDLEFAVLAAQTIDGRFDGDYERFHLRVDIAKDWNDTRTSDRHHSGLACLIESQIEPFHIRSREDVVRERIVIREVYLLPDYREDDVWLQLPVLLA